MGGARILSGVLATGQPQFQAVAEQLEKSADSTDQDVASSIKKATTDTASHKDVVKTHGLACSKISLSLSLPLLPQQYDHNSHHSYVCSQRLTDWDVCLNATSTTSSINAVECVEFSAHTEAILAKEHYMLCMKKNQTVTFSSNVTSKRS